MTDVPVGGFASAQSAAATDDTLELLSGTHVTSGRQSINKRLIIKSKEWSSPTYLGKYVTDATGHAQSDFQTVWQGTWSFDAAGTIIRGIAFDGRSGTSGPGSLDINGDNIVFEDCRFDDGYRWILISIGTTRATSGVTFRRCRFHGWGSRAAHDHALYLKTARNVVVEDCIFYEGNGWAFHCYTDCDNLVVRRCVVDRCNGGVMFSGDTANTGVTGNDGYSTNNAVEDSLFTNNMGGGSSAWGPAEKGAQTIMLAQYWYGSPQSGVNYLRRSDFWVGPTQQPQGGRILAGSPIVVENTVVNVNPLYTNNLAGNFKLQAGTPTAGMGPTYIQPASAPPPSPPNPVTGASATPGDGQIGLVWTNPVAGTAQDAVIVRWSTTGFPSSSTGGSALVSDTVAPFDTSVTHTGLVNGQTYYYSIFVRATVSSTEYFSTAVNVSATPSGAPPPPVTREVRTSGIVRTGPVRTGAVRTGTGG